MRESCLCEARDEFKGRRGSVPLMGQSCPAADRSRHAVFTRRYVNLVEIIRRARRRQRGKALGSSHRDCAKQLRSINISRILELVALPYSPPARNSSTLARREPDREAIPLSRNEFLALRGGKNREQC